MTQLTIRGFEPELESAIREVAQREKISLNQAVLRLLRQATGVAVPEGRPRIGSGLDRFIADWTPEQAEELDRSVAHLRVVDEDLWK